MASMAVQEGEDGDDLVSSKAIFSSYVCRSLDVSFSGEYKPVQHPGDIAESTSLSSVLLPPSTYPLREALPSELIQKGVLSNLQLEGVLYAATKHQQILPNGMRAGFFIGDGAGVGKGRQIAACILDNHVRGRRKHAWLSISSDLCLDARRDFADLGANITVINNVQALDKTSYKSGVLFLTYSSLISHVGTRSRLDQVIDWLGGQNFDGCLVFDEAHKAKNHRPGKEGQSTKVSIAVMELQQRLPNARVLYCSATGVSEVGHMAYMTRMGLWGPGTAFKDFDAFLDAMKKRGVSFLEMLAMELKAEGKYVARGLSFRDAEFSELEAILTSQQVDLYDKAAALWRDLLAGLNSALSLTGNDKRDVMKLYWSAQQRFFKLLCVSLKVPTVVAEAKAALESDCAVVIGLQTTGEAADASVGLEPGPVPGFVSTTKELLISFVKDHFPVTRVDKAADKGMSAASMSAPVPVSECVEVRAKLLEDINTLRLPPNFLDHIIDELGGPSQVAEMTGRKGRVVRVGNRFRFEIRAKPDSNDMDSLNVHEKELFMSGQRFVAIISDAASTGISLHASRTVKNQRRRVHLTIELPWSADKAIQQLGRSHRSNQVSGPIYKLISTPVGGEKRFAAAVARRLQSLGALTRGDRRAASGIDLSEQNFDSPLGRRSLRRMYDAIAIQSPQLPSGVSLTAILSETIKTQLGRPDMPDAEAEALADIQDPAIRTKTILGLHEQLREYTDVMGVGVSAPRNTYDTTAENLDLAGASDGLGAASAAALAGTEGKGGAAAKELGDVKRFLNRLLGLPVAHQNLLFAYFSAVLAAEVDDAKKKGTYSEGLSDLHSSRITSSGPRELVWEDPLSGLRTWRHDFTIDRGLSYEDAVAKLEHEVGTAALQQGKTGESNPTSPDAAVQQTITAHDSGLFDDQSGFRRSRRPLYGQYMVLLALRKPGSRNLYTVYRPNTGQSFLDIERSELAARYTRINPQDVQQEWCAAHKAALTHCMHGKECKQGATCHVGKRLAPVTVLSGSVVRVWGVLESVLARHEAELTRTERIMRVVRVELPPKPGAVPHAVGPVGMSDAGVAGNTTTAAAQQPAEQVCILSDDEGDSELEIVDDNPPGSQKQHDPPSEAHQQGASTSVGNYCGSTPMEVDPVAGQASAEGCEIATQAPGSAQQPPAAMAVGTPSPRKRTQSKHLDALGCSTTAASEQHAAGSGGTNAENVAGSSPHIGTPARARAAAATCAVVSPGSSKKGRQGGSASGTAADHIVGVRYPSALLPEVVAMLHSGAMQAVQAVAAEPAPGASRTYLREEPPSAVDTNVRVKVFQPPKLIHHYFKAAPAGYTQEGPTQQPPSVPPVASLETELHQHLKEKENIDGTQQDGPAAAAEGSTMAGRQVAAGEVGSRRGGLQSVAQTKQPQLQQAVAETPSQQDNQPSSKTVSMAGTKIGSGLGAGAGVKVHLSGPSALRGQKSGHVSTANSKGNGLSSWLLKGTPAARTDETTAATAPQSQRFHQNGRQQPKAAAVGTQPSVRKQQSAQHASTQSQGMHMAHPIQVIVLDSDDSNPPRELTTIRRKDTVPATKQQGGAADTTARIAGVAETAVKRELDVGGSGEPQQGGTSSAKRRRTSNGVQSGPSSRSPAQQAADVVVLDFSPVKKDGSGVGGDKDKMGPLSMAATRSRVIEELRSMGFSDAQAQRALFLADGDAGRAVEICLQGAM